MSKPNLETLYLLLRGVFVPLGQAWFLSVSQSVSDSALDKKFLTVRDRDFIIIMYT